MKLKEKKKINERLKFNIWKKLQRRRETTTEHTQFVWKSIKQIGMIINHCLIFFGLRLHLKHYCLRRSIEYWSSVDHLKQQCAQQILPHKAPSVRNLIKRMREWDREKGKEKNEFLYLIQLLPRCRADKRRTNRRS